MSDTIVVMNQGYIQQIGTPESIYNEPENAFVADFIGDSNIIGATMIRDRLVEILGARFDCVDTGFGENKPVDVVIRPEDVELVAPEEGIIHGTLTHSISKVSITKWKLWPTVSSGWYSPRNGSCGDQSRHQSGSVQHPDHEEAGIRG